MAVSEADPPEVIQGRLGWESGDISEAKPSELEPHLKNREIYGDTDHPDDLGEQFIESIRQNGVLEPLVIAEGKQIISGHRRWLAAKAVDLDSVPVRYAEFDSELAEREALIEFNRQREKTPGQLVNEFEEIVEIEQERAKERQEATQLQGRDSDGNPVGGGNVSTTEESGKSRDKAAEKLNASVSGRTLEKGLKVKEAADEGDETAQQEWDKLFSGDTSFHTAAKTLEKSEAEEEVDEQETVDRKHEPQIYESDAVEFLQQAESPDLVIADPPFSTELDDVVSFARSWVEPLIDAIGETGQAFIFIGAYPKELQAYLNVFSVLESINRVQVLVWTYKNTLGQTPTDAYKQNWQAVLFIQSDPPADLDSPLTSEQWAVQEVNAPDARTGERHHRWEKPGELIRRFIRHTTDEDDFVVDPFAGSGTTLLEAADLGRRATGVDNDLDMVELAVERGCVRRA